MFLTLSSVWSVECDRVGRCTGRPPYVSGAVVDWNSSIDLSVFIEERQMNSTVATICSKMQILTQMYQ